MLCHKHALEIVFFISALPSKNTVSTNIKHSIYPFNVKFLVNPLPKRLYVHMFAIVDTAFSYERGLIVC